MPVPKRKHSRSRRDMKHANKGMDYNLPTYCQTTQEPVAPHTVCLTSGYYKGIKILRTKAERAIQRAQVRKAIEDGRAMRRAGGQASSSVQAEGEAIN